MTDLRHPSTERLRLDVPTPEDLVPLHEIYSDPRVWTHFPSLRHADISDTRQMLQAWIAAWQSGLGPWIVRGRDDDSVLGNAGCSLRDGWWNLGYRFAADSHGQGLATEACRPGIEAALAVRPDVPVIAYLVEHNRASARVAEKLGLTLQHRSPDKGNPDPSVLRLVYADRQLTASQLQAALG